jgi:apolipoprotein N-acyltransferase
MNLRVVADTTVYEGSTGRVVGALYSLAFGAAGVFLIWLVVSRDVSTVGLVFGGLVGLVFVGSALYAAYRTLTEDDFSVRVRSGPGGGT